MTPSSVAGRKAEERWLGFVSWTASSAARLAGASFSSTFQSPHQISSIASLAPRS